MGLNQHINEFIAQLDAHIRWYSEARIKISLGSMGLME